jgi:CheY-like chemotaxis protein
VNLLRTEPRGAPAAAGRLSSVEGRARSAGPSATPYRVLIADDNVDAAVALAFLLDSAGYDVHIARDGQEALETARRLHPDAILLDIAMPKVTGDEVCRQLRREPWTDGVLIAAVTGFSAADARERSRSAGFDHHFVKPLDAALLRQLLQSL